MATAPVTHCASAKQYQALLHSSPFNIDVNKPSTIQCKINLKSSEWSMISTDLRAVEDLLCMFASIMYNVRPLSERNPNSKQLHDSHQHIGVSCLKYLNTSEDDLCALRVCLKFYRNLTRKIYVFNESLIVSTLSGMMCVPCPQMTTVGFFEQFVKRHFDRILKISWDIRVAMFPVSPDKFTLRYILALIHDSTLVKQTIQCVLDSDTNYYYPFTMTDVLRMEQFHKARNINSPLMIIVDGLLSYNTHSFDKFLVQQSDFNRFLELRHQQSTTSNNVDVHDGYLEMLAELYHINIVCLKGTKLIPYLCQCQQANYCVFVVHNCSDAPGDFGVYNVLQHRNKILIDHSVEGDWSSWLSKLDKWNPVFAEVWEYFEQTGEHVAPIQWMKDKKGITVFGVPFVTQLYKSYLKSSEDKSNANSITPKCHTIYVTQYEDAFNFVKRQSSERYRVHTEAQYVQVELRELLQYRCFKDIHKMICDNAKHGIYSANVSPIFKKVVGFNNDTMFLWWKISNRFKDKVSGYYTVFGPLYNEDLYNTSVDPVTESVMGYDWEAVPMFNADTMRTHSLGINEFILIIASMYIEYLKDPNLELLFNCKIPVYSQLWRTLKGELPVDKPERHDLRLESFFSSRLLFNMDRYNANKLDADVIIRFVSEYLVKTGPFAVFISGVLDVQWTNYIYELLIYT